MFPYQTSARDGSRRESGGTVTAVAMGERPCRFVSRGCSNDDEEELMVDAQSVVCRSTPVFASSSDHMSISDSEFGSYRENPSPSPKVPIVKWVSIANDYPLSRTGTSNLLQPQPTSHTSLASMDQHPTAATSTGSIGFVPFVSTAERVTPPLGTILEVTQPDEQTILNRSATIRKESGDENRHSPFGPIVMQETQPYQYNATKSEVDEMEQMKWNLQEQVFQRYFDLKQKEPQWGSLEVRESRIFFHPGKRREAIMTEKKFHDQTYNEGITGGDAAWYRNRRAQFNELLRDFTRDETKHKQELMLAHLEKNSPFSKFPILANRFLMMRLLGKGGNGEVWDIIDFADQKRRWALKLSVSHKHARREHYTHSRLRHPNIVGVGDAAYTIEYRQQLYTAFTVESVDTDLQQLIEMFEYFDEGSALKVLYQLLNALTYLHDEMKIAHYDIKPTNILIGRDETVKLTDFDLARNVHEPITSSVVGTLRYLPPECFRPNFGDCQGTAEKADIWMVGVVFCVMLSGKHPIVADKATHDQARAMIGCFSGSPHYPQHVSDLSRWIIQGCLHPDPRCRPSAFQLLQALQSASQQQ